LTSATSPRFRVADVVRRFGAAFRAGRTLTREQDKALRDVAQRRTASLGGHVAAYGGGGTTAGFVMSAPSRRKCAPSSSTRGGVPHGRVRGGLPTGVTVGPAGAGAVDGVAGAGEADDRPSGRQRPEAVSFNVFVPDPSRAGAAGDLLVLGGPDREESSA
jgi:hypothetical protein